MATRDITTVLNNALDDAVVAPFFAIDMAFSTGNLRIWTGVGTATIDGSDYTGVGDLLSISTVEETTEIAARGASLVLSGVPTDIITLALTSQYQGRVATIYFGIRDGGTYTGLTEVFSGYMDEMNVDEGPDTSTVELKIENKLIDLERARVRRYNSGYQKTVHPTDLGFDFIEDLQNREIAWKPN